MAGKSEWRKLWDALQQFEGDPLESLGDVEAVAKSLLLSSVKEDNRRVVTHDDVSLLKTILEQLIAQCPTTVSLSWRPDVVGTLTSVLKLMRNLCAGVPLNQEMMLEGDTIDQVVTLSSSVASLESPKAVVMVQAGLQLLGNVCVKCAEGQERVWQLCFPNNFKTLMQQGSTDVANVCCMVLHTCTCENSTLRNQLCSSPAGGDVIAQVLSCLATSDQSEWMVYLLESLASSTPLESLWETLEKHSRVKITLLSFIGTGLADCKDIGSQSDSSLLPKVLNEQNLMFLAGSFQRQSQLLLSDNAAPLNVTFAAKTTDLEDPNVILVQVTMETMRLICMFGEREQWLMVLQQHLAVCDTALALLRQLASLDGSDVSARHRSRLSSVQPTGDEYQCPTFGLKRLLVQLIGHLCYRSPLVQDKIREDDAIPLILNQCSIDHHNPYITQWAVLAIRNLCEGNTTNQELIASLECKGVEKTQPLLAELGCEVEIGDDGKIKVKNVKQK